MGAEDRWANFRKFYEMYKCDELEVDEANQRNDILNFKKAIQKLIKHILTKADVVVATAIQGRLDLLANITFSHVITDESSVMTLSDLLCCWRAQEILIMVGDDAQLSAVARSNKDTNPMHLIAQGNAFEYFLHAGHPYFMLTEQMRMKKGLMNCDNELFYDGRLLNGLNTTIRPDDLAIKIKAFLHERYPEIEPEPADEVRPLLLQVKGAECMRENQGTSRYNPHHVSAIIDIIKAMLVKIPELSPAKIGIAVGYSAQARVFGSVKHLLRKEQPEAGWDLLMAGPAESWQGKEREVMIVDFVRAANDDGSIGYMKIKKRLNVLITRQRQGVIIVGDPASVGADPDHPTEGSNAIKDDVVQDNRTMIKTLQYIMSRARFVVVEANSLAQTYVTLPQQEQVTWTSFKWDTNAIEQGVTKTAVDDNSGNTGAGEWNPNVATDSAEWNMSRKAIPAMSKKSHADKGNAGLEEIVGRDDAVEDAKASEDKHAHNDANDKNSTDESHTAANKDDKADAGPVEEIPRDEHDKQEREAEADLGEESSGNSSSKGVYEDAIEEEFAERLTLEQQEAELLQAQHPDDKIEWWW